MEFIPDKVGNIVGKRRKCWLPVFSSFHTQVTPYDRLTHQNKQEFLQQYMKKSLENCTFKKISIVQGL